MKGLGRNMYLARFFLRWEGHKGGWLNRSCACRPYRHILYLSPWIHKILLLTMEHYIKVIRAPPRISKVSPLYIRVPKVPFHLNQCSQISLPLYQFPQNPPPYIGILKVILLTLGSPEWPLALGSVLGGRVEVGRKSIMRRKPHHPLLNVEAVCLMQAYDWLLRHRVALVTNH